MNNNVNANANAHAVAREAIVYRVTRAYESVSGAAE